MTIGESLGATDAANEDDFAEGLDDGAGHLNQGPTDTQLKQIAELAIKQVHQERQVELCEKELKTAQDDLKQTAERDLPSLMSDAGISEFKLTNGAKISIKTKVVAAILAANRPAAFEWLHKHGYGPIVKRDVEVQFGRGDAKKAGKLLGYLTRWFKDFKVSDKEAVHASTLNAWARELLEKNAASLKDGGKILEPPTEVISILELKASVVSVPDGVTDL